MSIQTILVLTCTLSCFDQHVSSNKTYTRQAEENTGTMQEIGLRMGHDRYPRTTRQQTANLNLRRIERISMIREARGKRKIEENKQLLIPARQLYQKRREYKEKEDCLLNSTTKEPPTFHSNTKRLTDVQPTTKKYAGVKFPRINIFPQLQKSSFQQKRKDPPDIRPTPTLASDKPDDDDNDTGHTVCVPDVQHLS